MTRARWLGVYTEARPNALPRDEHNRRALLGVVRDAIIAIGVVAATVVVMPMIIEAAADDIRRDPGAASVPIAAGCPPPTEHEQLHIVIVQRAGQLVTDCRYVGARGTYQRSRHGMPEVRP